MRICAFLAILLLAAPAYAQGTSYLIRNSTPDISVTSTATIEVFRQSGGPASTFAIKNDCSDTLYFAVNNGGWTVSDYFLRLEANESFSGRAFRLYTLMASPDSTGSATCTFTLILGD